MYSWKCPCCGAVTKGTEELGNVWKAECQCGLIGFLLLGKKSWTHPMSADSGQWNKDILFGLREPYKRFSLQLVLDL